MSTKFEELCNQLSKEMPKKEKKGSRRLRIFKILVQERFPHLLNPVYSNESKANSISYFWETTVYEILQNLDMVRFRKEISKD